MPRLRFFLVCAALLTLAAALIGCGGSKSNNNSSATDEPAAATASETAQARAAAGTPSTAAGETVSVGNLEVTVVSVRPFNARQYDQFNSSDVAVHIQIVNGRADSQAFAPTFDFKLIDTKGVAHEPEQLCKGCPDQLQTVTLKRGEGAEGNIYVKLGGATPATADVTADPNKQMAQIPVVLSAAESAKATPRASATADPNSPDCKYATSVFAVIFNVALSAPDFSQSGSSNGTPGPAGDAAPTPEQLKSSIEKALTTANQGVADLNKITPPADLKQYHADLVALLKAVIPRLQNAQKALIAGDTQKASDLLKTAFEDSGQNLDVKYPEQSARFTACLN